MKIRKYETRYAIIWKGEEIDEADSRKEALYLQREYNLAYGGGCTLKARRVRI